MVSFSVAMNVPVEDFQYSLCRVVLMVNIRTDRDARANNLSVLALSSRFDGQPVLAYRPATQHIFQYSLCRVVLMVHA